MFRRDELSVVGKDFVKSEEGLIDMLKEEAGSLDLMIKLFEAHFERLLQALKTKQIDESESGRYNRKEVAAKLDTMINDSWLFRNLKEHPQVSEDGALLHKVLIGLQELLFSHLDTHTTRDFLDHLQNQLVQRYEPLHEDLKKMKENIQKEILVIKQLRHVV